MKEVTVLVTRWLIALSITLLLIAATIWLFMVPFEWMLMRSVSWGIWLHLLFWVVFGVVILKIFTGIGLTFLNSVSVILIGMGQKYYQFLLMIIIFYGGLLVIISLWFGWIEFSWQQLKYPIWNKIIFSISLAKIIMLGQAIIDDSQRGR